MTSLVTKTTWSAVASLANTVGRFIASVIIARRLGPSGVGQLAYLIWLIDFMNVFSNLGLQNSLTRFLAELYGRGRSSESSLFAGWIFRRYLISVITGGLLVALVSARFSRHASVGSATGLLVLLFMLQGLASLTTAELTGRQRFDTLARINGFAAILLVVGQIFGVYFFGLLGAIGGYIIGALLPGLFSLGMLRSGSPGWRPEPALQRRIWKYAAYTWLAAIVSAFVWSRVEVFFIERYWNPHEVAMFTIGLSLAALATQGPSLLLGALLPHFAALFGAGDKAAIDRAYSTGTRLMGLLLFPLAFGGAAVTPVLLPMLFGPQFAPAIPNAMVLMALSCLGFAGVGSSLVYGMERSRFIAFGGFLGAAVSLGACVWIIPIYGAWGATWIKVFVQIGMIALGMWYIAYRLNCSVPLRSLSKAMLSAGGCATVAWVILHAWPAVAALPLAILLGAFTYVWLVRVIGAVNGEDARLFRSIFSRFPLNFRTPMIRCVDWMECKT
ncbi:MAG: oligosaccharide flippase family protein [Desulfomonilaceae bacterium]